MRNIEHDWRDPKTQVLARAALAKAGIKLNSDSPNPTTSEMLNDRNALRRLINDVKDRADAAITRGDNGAAEDAIEEMEALGAISKRIQTSLDCRTMAASYNEPTGAESWGKAGSTVPVLSRSESFAKAVRADRMAPESTFGFGEYVKAMVSGTERHEIRAALSEGTDSAGGYTVPTFLLVDLIDKMRNRTAIVQAGARTVPLQAAQTKMARIASDPTAAWRLEAGAINVSDPTFEAVTFTARSLACLVKVSRELLEDSVNINAALMQAFAGSMAAEVDRVCLFGSGTPPEPLGVNGTTNVGIVSMGTNGAQLTSWAKVLDTVLEIKQDNGADPTGMIMSPRTWRTIEGFADSTGQPLQPPPSLVQVPRFVTGNVLNTMTQGSASNASAIVIGDFSQMLLGVRSELRVEVLRELYAANHQYAFVAHLRFDVQLAHPESFAVLRGIIP